MKKCFKVFMTFAFIGAVTVMFNACNNKTESANVAVDSDSVVVNPLIDDSVAGIDTTALEADTLSEECPY